MKKLKCSSCGANMRIDENNEYAICDYCGTKYKLKEDVNVNISFDEDIKKGFKYIIKFRNKTVKIILLFIILSVLLTFCSVVKININSNETRSEMGKNQEQVNEFNNKIEEEKEQIYEFYKQNEENMNNNKKNMEVLAFNNKFEIYKGNGEIFFVKVMLDEVMKSNTTNENKIINVKYNDTDTNDIDEIKNIKQLLNQEEYIVTFEYDNEGYINKMIIR